MPTILERLAALFSRDMRAVLRNPRAISMIENPSIRVQMAAIRSNLLYPISSSMFSR